jgi:hypothetical protein
MVSQERNVLAPFSQGWKLELNHVQSVVEVFTELPLFNHLA